MQPDTPGRIDDLHDASLVRVQVDWAGGTCTADILHGTAGACALAFSEVSHVILPRQQAWGRRSVSINAFRQAGSGHYEIEMQSGDVIVIDAREVRLVAGHGVR